MSYMARLGHGCDMPMLRGTPKSYPGFKADTASSRSLSSLDIDGSKIAGCFDQYDPADHAEDHIQTDFRV
jgi:hypothetical protein